MSDTETMKEFLVALGFQLDDAGKKKFDDSIFDATTAVGSLGETVKKTAGYITDMTKNAATGLDSLYFAAGRMNSSVNDVRAMQYGMGQLGSSGEAALASMENLANFMRTYPGSKEFLAGLGVAPQHLNDAAAAMRDLEASFQKMSFWQAKPLAQMLGIDDKTLMALQSGELDQFLEKHNERLRRIGLSEDEVARKANHFKTETRNLADEFVVAGDAFVDSFYGPIQKGFTLLEAFAKGLQILFKDPAKFSDNLANFLRAVSPDSFYPKGAISKPDLVWPSGSGMSGVAAPNPLGVRGNNPGNIRNVNGVGFQQYPTVEAGLDAMAKQLLRYQTHYGLSTIDQIVNRWAPSSENDTAAYIADVSKRTGFSPNQSLNLHDPAQLQALMSAMAIHEGNKGLSASLYSNAAAAATGGSTTINQTNTFNVSGSSSPQATALSVSDRLDDANKQLARNVGGSTNAWGGVE